MADLGHAATQARLITLAEQTLFEYLRASQQVFPVWYEDLFVNGAILDEVTHWLNINFELDLTSAPKPVVRQNRVSKRLKVSNYAEVDAAIDRIVAAHGRVRWDAS